MSFDIKSYKVVYMGIDASLLGKYKNRMASYNLIEGKVYTINDEVGMLWLVIDGGFFKSEPQRTEEVAIDRDLMRFFKPLSEVRNDKIDEILHEEDKKATL